MIVKV